MWNYKLYMAPFKETKLHKTLAKITNKSHVFQRTWKIGFLGPKSLKSPKKVGKHQKPDHKPCKNSLHIRCHNKIDMNMIFSAPQTRTCKSTMFYSVIVHYWPILLKLHNLKLCTFKSTGLMRPFGHFKTLCF